jgi:hypothetical protein
MSASECAGLKLRKCPRRLDRHVGKDLTAFSGTLPTPILYFCRWAFALRPRSMYLAILTDQSHEVAEWLQNNGKN